MIERLQTAPVLMHASRIAPAATVRPTPAPFQRTVRWAVIVAATAMSTFALDIIAAASGVLLAASHLFDGVPQGVVLGFLAATYLLWAAALRSNLTANWRLLEETGTSTNLLSKLMFELARLRSSSRRARRAASAAGYVVTEIAKEAPYYAGAFGTALLSDTVDSIDALVFLAGSNVGAGVYECSVARLSHIFLNRRSQRIDRLRIGALHGDLSPGNVLCVDGRLSAVIDFGGVGVGGPACDLAGTVTDVIPRRCDPYSKARG